MAHRLSCAVIVTDGRRLLLGHATRSPRWDLPKGVAEPGETPAAAAVRELDEETGLIADVAAPLPLGAHAYRPGKDLALFAWHRCPLPDPAALVCRSRFTTSRGESLPELDRFALVDWDEASRRVAKSLAPLLARVRPALETG